MHDRMFFDPRPKSDSAIDLEDLYRQATASMTWLNAAKKAQVEPLLYQSDGEESISGAKYAFVKFLQ